MDKDIEEVATEVSELVKIKKGTESLIWIKRLLKAAAPDIELKSFADNGAEKFLIATVRGHGDVDQRILLSGHIDVFMQTSRESEWKFKPFSGKLFILDNEVIVYGCGSSDMKGGIVSIVETLIELSINKNLTGTSIMGVFTSDEETGSYQSLRKYGHMLPLSSCSIIAEPTSLNFYYVGEKGEMTLASKNEMELTRVKNAILEYGSEGTFPSSLNDISTRSNQVFSSWNFTENIREFDAIIVRGVDKHYLEVEIPVFYDYHDYLKLMNYFSKIGDSFEVVDYVPPSLTSMETRIVKQLKSSSSAYVDSEPEPLLGYCGTEAPFFRNMGIPTIVYGPGEPILSHQPNEFVKVSAVMKYSKILKDVILELARKW